MFFAEHSFPVVKNTEYDRQIDLKSLCGHSVVPLNSGLNSPLQLCCFSYVDLHPTLIYTRNLMNLQPAGKQTVADTAEQYRHLLCLWRLIQEQK